MLGKKPETYIQSPWLCLSTIQGYLDLLYTTYTSIQIYNKWILEYLVLWDILKSPNWESGKASGRQVKPYKLGPAFLSNFDFYNDTD